MPRAPIRPALVICCKDYRYIQPTLRFVKQRLGIRWDDLKATAGVLPMLDSPHRTAVDSARYRSGLPLAWRASGDSRAS